MDRIIFHVDLDAFFASCEVLRDPSLKGQPVIVGADPKEGKGRGVVSTSSYEARKFGVKSGMPISRAYKLCPQGIYLRPDIRYYKEISDQIMEILRSYADSFEQWGIDEAFLDVTKQINNNISPIELAQKIKDEIYTKIQLTCSIGIGPNKQVAKIASDFKKPDGLTYVPLDKVRSFLDPLPVEKIIGVGPKFKKSLNEKLNIETIADLANYPAEKLNKMFGKMGIYLHQVAHGIDNSPVREDYKRKSIGAEITFDEDVEDFKVIYKSLELLIDKLHKDILKGGFLFQTVVVKIRFSNFSTYTRQKRLKAPTNDKKVALKIGKYLLKEFESEMKKKRLLGFRFTELSKSKFIQKTLID
ncbi:MAG TPA: DNA polymerase IV [Candidatus Deferrimicrobium sp.]|nr:DNA polymerase IV [Candidatus Deferrimicrobium sp.]